ncbi:MAG TPA: thioesterase family protein [Polyangiaceae bacterium]|jgi:acyl-CoA thioesterase|nr:thioesterase family protein [Polyangiaceae bacterium]
MPPADTTRFDRDTAIVPIESGRYEGHIDAGWWIVNGPNGGYIAAILLRALIAEVDDLVRAPRSLTIHYLRPPAEGPVDIHTVKEREGRTLTTATARLFQDDKLIAIAVAAFAAARTGFEFVDRKMPAMPPADSCPKIRDKYPMGVELQQRYDSRWCTPHEMGSGSGEARVGGYIRFEEPRIVDALAVAAFTDSFPPAVFTRASQGVALGPVPTIDLTIHFRATLPLSGATPTDRCIVQFTSIAGHDGYVEEDAEIWSEGGVLLAQSRQLALVGG